MKKKQVEFNPYINYTLSKLFRVFFWGGGGGYEISGFNTQ